MSKPGESPSHGVTACSTSCAVAAAIPTAGDWPGGLPEPMHLPKAVRRWHLQSKADWSHASPFVEICTPTPISRLRFPAP